MNPTAREISSILLRAATNLRRRFERACREQGVTFQQYTVLRILRDAQREGEGPLPTMTVAERLIEPVPGITRMLDRLEHKGYVRREGSPDDARISLCRISRKGLAAVTRLDGPIEKVECAALEAISRADQRTLTTLLGHLVDD